MPRLQIDWDSTPQQAYMFKVDIEGLIETRGDYGWLYAKSVKLPTIGVETIDVNTTNSKHVIAGKFKKESVNLQLYTYQSKTVQEVLNWFHLVHGKIADTGFGIGTIRTGQPGLRKSRFIYGEYDSTSGISGWYNEYVKNVYIYELDEEGYKNGTYTLFDCFIESISFGEFNYESEEIVSIDLTLRYENFKYEVGTQSPSLDAIANDVSNLA